MVQKQQNLWARLSAFDNLYLAFKKAAKGKRSKPDVAAFEFDLESNLLQLRNDLKDGSYQPGGYTSFFIHDPKHRLISAALFRDRVVHHAIINVIDPYFEGRFIYDTYANRKGKGTHRALDRCTQFLRKFDFVLPLDIRQFFPSIDHATLLNILAQTIEDEKVLNLCQKIISSGQGVLQEVYEMVYFPGDDLFANLRPRGLPIGNLTSQFWANVYLNNLDHFIKRQLKCYGYIRYVDDMLLFSDSKVDLKSWKKEVIQYLIGLRLSIHIQCAQTRPSRVGIPFLGFQVYCDHRRLKRRKAVHARRRIKWLAQNWRHGDINQQRLAACLQGWLNHARYGDTWGLRKSILDEADLLFQGGNIV